MAATQTKAKNIVSSRADETFFSMETTPDNRWAAACSSAGHVYFGPNPQTVEEAAIASTGFVFNPWGLSSPSPTTGIAFNPRQTNADTYLALSISSSGVVRQSKVDGSTGSHPRVHKELSIAQEQGNETLACGFDTSGTVFATGGSDSKLRIYDVESNAVISTIQKSIGAHGQDTVGHHSRIFSVRFRDEFTFFSAGWGSSMFLQDTRTRGPAQIYEGVHMSGDAIAVMGSVVVAGSERGQDQVQVFDISSGKRLLSVTTQMNVFACRGASQQSIVWAAGSQPSGLAAVDISNGSIISYVDTFEGALYGLSMFKNTQNFYACGTKGVYYISN